MKAKTALKIVRNSHSNGDPQLIAVGKWRSVIPPCLFYLLCAAILLSPVGAAAQLERDNKGDPTRAPAESISGTLNLSSSLGNTINLSAPASSIFVADPTIADFQAASNRTIFVFGKKSGRTSLFALNDNGEPLVALRVVVTQPIEDLRAMLKAQIGEYPIKVNYTPQGAILSGTAPNAEAVDTAMRVTEHFLGAGATVINKIQVAGSLQINLSVRVAEVSRSALKELGVNISAMGQSGTFIFGFSSGKSELWLILGDAA